MKLTDNPRAYGIMACMMKVHKVLGCGFLESAYGDALEIEFKLAGIPYKREDEVFVYYAGHKLATRYRADFTCYDGEYIVELKAIKTLGNVERAQLIHYLRATKTRFGMLVNFGAEKLQYETVDMEALRKIKRNSDESEDYANASSDRAAEGRYKNA